jgi:DNA primase
MAKVSPVSIKYMIHASFTAAGPLEKPDVIGAIFGQTEGLLGEELEMRELQKEGKIGRIEVNLETVDGKSVGDIQVPTALDKSETTLIAAALETIDKIGPTEASIKVTKLEDVRGSKRDFILQRAKALLSGLDESGGDEMSKQLKEESRAAKIQEYGDERLPAGDISGNELIVVEGRADVVNMLKNRVNNVIGMNGTKLPAEIAKLGATKEITLFVDGDRGGKLIARNVIDNARIAYVAVAPDGKEVEELQGKEILLALRKKVPVGIYLRSLRNDDYDAPRRDSYRRDSYGRDAPVAEEHVELPVEEVTEMEEMPEYSGNAKEALRTAFQNIAGSKQALMLNSNMEVIRKMPSKDLARIVRMSRTRVYAIVVDGTATSGVMDLCEEIGVKYLGATNFAHADSKTVQLISL